MRITENLNLEKISPKCVGLIIKISCFRTLKLSKNELDDILDIFYDYFNLIKGVFCFS